MSNKKEFLNLVTGEDNIILEELRLRKINRSWLKKSRAVALKILKTLKEQGLSQKDLAKMLDVTPQQVNKWVKGQVNFRFDTVSKIENALGIQLHYTEEDIIKQQNTFQKNIEFIMDEFIQVSLNDLISSTIPFAAGESQPIEQQSVFDYNTWSVTSNLEESQYYQKRA